jgi:hypothetical protein
MTVPEAGGRRLIGAADSLSMTQMGRVLCRAFPDYCEKIPTRTLPGFLVRFLANFNPTLKTVVPDIGLVALADNAYVTEMTGVEFRPAEDAVRAAGQSLIDHSVKHGKRANRRKSMVRKALAFGCMTLVVVVIVVGAYAVITLSSAVSKENITQTVELDGCRLISGVIGPEDFEYLPEANGLVVSSLDRRAPEETPGGLYWIDLTKPPEEQVAEPILTDYPGHFKPHGLTFQPTEEGGRLFVISHPETGEWPHTIEIFSLTSSDGTRAWEHVQTLTGELLISPNDLVALPDGSLFISNDFQDLGGVPGLVVDTLLQRQRAPLVYYDGSEFTDLDANVLSSAGITAANEGDREFLYRDIMNKGVEKLEVHWDQPGGPRVELVETIHLDTAGADNFTVDEEGVVYVATHYSFGLLTDHADDENALSPTQIFKILPNGEATLIYANKGDEFSAGSVGTVVDNRLLIGQIFNDGILSCPLEK